MSKQDESGSPVDISFQPESVKLIFVSPKKMADNTNGKISRRSTSPQQSAQSTQTNDENKPTSEVLLIANQLAIFIINVFDKNGNIKRVDTKYSRTMARTAKELSEKHAILFTSMVNKLHIDSNNLTHESFRQIFHMVLDEMFSDGKVNWGRIVTIYAFGGRLAQHCSEHNVESYKKPLAEMIGNYVGNKLGKWIQSNGGWDGFVEFFPSDKAFEDTLWRGLLYTAVGLGTLAAMVAAR